MVARGIWDAEAAGSSPVTPTTLWRVSQEVKTSPFHGEDTGSSPVPVTIKIRTAIYNSFGIVNPRVVGSSPTRCAYGATVAQSVEQVMQKNVSCFMPA